MAIYINPPAARGKVEKLALIREAASSCSMEQFLAHPPGLGGQWGVCVVDNGPFNAAAICEDEMEVRRFTAPDPRTRHFFTITEERLETLDAYALMDLRKALSRK